MATHANGEADVMMNRPDQVFALAQDLALERPTFFDIKGPSIGDKDTASFMQELWRRAIEAFGQDFAEQKICGENGLCVDYYFPDEATIVEVAMGLRNPNSEFERDILKAIMAQDAGKPVRRLVFIAKPGAAKKCAQPSARAIIDWAERVHGITITVLEFRRT